MALTVDRSEIGIHRHFTTAGVHPYDMVEWEKRDSRITDYRTGEVAFEQLDVEVPKFWSMNATNILAQKYFRGNLGEPERETSLKQVVDRVVDSITAWGKKDGYFNDNAEAEAFSDELKYLIITQKAAFNSPVWFNIGVKDVPQQASACFILAVEDSMTDILNWYAEEGIIFKGGSGAGVNLSRIRSSKEPLKGGGTASGPVSFMRGADASAGTIKSGGKTRRAAKMVVLDIDHPDIYEFIWCKAIEERKARALKEAGFDMDLDGKDSFSVQYQNANNSVRITDAFMEQVLADGSWPLLARTTGKPVTTVKARDLFRQIAEAAWQCADPGLQFDTTINRWHTAPNTGRISASNPCSEYVHLDNSACNLASLNLLSFLQEDGIFDVDAFKSAVEVVFTAQEILVGNADYPTEKIKETTKKFRQLGLGYANLGAMLMALGLSYDSDEARATASSITALMTGHAYFTSAKIASRKGPFEGYEANREPMLAVLKMHSNAVAKIDEDLAPTYLLTAAQEAFDNAVELAEVVGVRNAQATVLAPTGTISFLMDCDTTGIEPDLALVKTKKLVGGGTMSIVNQTVARALEKLGYTKDERVKIIDWIDKQKTIVGAPSLKPEHLKVFACSMGDNTIHYSGHVKMMAAAQPFISGAISKTVNMPEDVTVEDVEQLHIDAWKLGLKAVAIYRDNCKVGQPLSTTKKGEGTLQVSDHQEGSDVANGDIAELLSKKDLRIKELEENLKTVEQSPAPSSRKKLPRKRRSTTFGFRVADCEGYVTAGEYDDGRLGEVFMKVSKQGSTLSGVMDAFSIAVSLGLQHGVPLSTFVKKYTNMRFEPAGITDDKDLRLASSLVDYIFRRLALDYLPEDERIELGILSTGERIEAQLPLPGLEAIEAENVAKREYDRFGEGGDREKSDDKKDNSSSSVSPAISLENKDAPFCYACGNVMQRAGSCYACPSCGATSGCS